ncbi:MAG: AAA family ATPase, partial [Clostridia bacterium]|nr:AAA family ATPase [Clostridia bacterium]
DRVDGISFKTADNIAHILGIAKNSPERISAFIKYTLTNAAYISGHTFLPKELLCEHIVSNLEITDDEAENAIVALSTEKDLYCDTVGGVTACYLSHFLTAESYVARRIYTLSQADQKYTLPTDEAQDIIDEIAKSEGIVLADEQKEAVYQALMNGCVVITGGPGTGKTTTINTIIRLMQYLKLNIVLAAPTGRAAKRMSEVTGLEAKTVHRLLGVVRNDDNAIPQFTRDEANPLSADVIIVDEASMLDINLTNSLLRAVKAGAKVIFVGDSDQLPAVGPGNVLGDIIESGAVPVIKLSHIFRQAQESLIVVNAHRINRGEAPVFKAENPDFFFIRRDSQSDAAATIADLYKNRLPFKYNINPINSIQVLSPSKKGSAGTQMLNALLQQEINPPDYMKTELASGKKIYRVGDKVMQIKNNYDLEWITDSGEEGSGIFNGDMGVIEKISLIDKVMDIVFDENKHVEYSFSYIDELDLAYAVTVHKSQGNEFPYVLIPICSFSPFLMFRNLLYTAVTRAKEMAIIVGDEKSILKMINNSERSKRYS